MARVAPIPSLARRGSRTRLLLYCLTVVYSTDTVPPYTIVGAKPLSPGLMPKISTTTPTPTTEWEPVHPSNTRFCTPSSRLRRTIADVRIRFAGTIFPHIERLLHLYGICTCAYISLESTRSRAPVGTRRESPWMWARRVVA